MRTLIALVDVLTRTGSISTVDPIQTIPYRQVNYTFDNNYAGEIVLRSYTWAIIPLHLSVRIIFITPDVNFLCVVANSWSQ